MKKFNFKLVSSLILTALGITQIWTMVLLMFTGNVNYLYAAVSLLVSMFFVMVFFDRFIED
jgi:hypothetical protein